MTASTTTKPPSTRDRVRAALDHAGRRGATSHEIEQSTGLGHGTVSGALSHLERLDQAIRLETKRGNHSVYLLTIHATGVEHKAAVRRRARQREYLCEYKGPDGKPTKVITCDHDKARMLADRGAVVVYRDVPATWRRAEF